MIEINNLTRFKIQEKNFRKITETILRQENLKTNISIAIVGSQEIKKINKKYRKQDKPTDVLSFLYDDVGEILICPEIVKKNAKEDKEKFEDAMIKVLIHGILHILGYDHEKSKKAEKEMFLKQDYYFSKIINK